MEPKVYPVCVIGGGSAGIMAVLRTVLNNDDCLFLPGTAKDKKKSRALWVRKIENMPAHFNYKRGIEEPNAETIKWIQESAFKERLHLLKNTGATTLEKTGDHFKITDSKGEVHLAKFVILCTGVMDVQPIIKGSIETVFDYANAQTIDYCLICDGHHVLGKKTGVIGSSNSAAWVSIMLYERYQPSKLTIFTNGETPTFAPDTEKIIQAYNIEVKTSPIKEILGEEKGKVLKGFQLEDGEEVKTDITFVSLGMIVYNELALQVRADVDERGFVKTDETGLTSVNGLYVAGDLKANSKKQIYTAWDEAVNSANAINQKLRQEKRSRLLNS
ncbi:MAG: NAD(P)/FAD-dependent oxidoreductase [Bdellovibrionota bacterium]